MPPRLSKNPPKQNGKDKISHVYVRNQENVWVPALQLKSTKGKATVAVPVFKAEHEMLHCSREEKQRYHENEVVDLKDYENGVLPRQNVDSNGRLEEYRDMVALPFMSEAAILYNLKLRHLKEKPYTRTGDILIAVNPYQWYNDLYTEEKRSYYANRLVWQTHEEDPRATMEPHVYEVSALCYKGLAQSGNNQSILVSGESGAGKTETVKICLNHIARVQRGEYDLDPSDALDPVVQRVVESNPLLEAFGNAKTRRNDNSSRFGKYLQLQFNKNAASEFGGSRCALVGSKCDVYLLEKNRVVSHDSEERTFHIFYQLLATPDDQRVGFWEGLKGKQNKDFKYVGHSDTKAIEGVSDADHFRSTVDALSLVGVSGDKLNTLMRAICVVLQLGNLTFEEDKSDCDKSVISSSDELSALSTLMGISKSDLTVALTERTFNAKNETHKVPLNADMAGDARDALAKEAYQKTFLWLVQAVNTATSVEGVKNSGIVGLLDIFGFETFEVNRFEQLCINYANEKLQQKFNEDIFANVQAEYKAEGISLDDIFYEDNTEVLDLIEGKTGLLALLNEECVRPGGNDASYVQKALQNNKKALALIINRTDRLSFAIKHYAGVVMYDAFAFVSKNLDTLPSDLQLCAEKCSNDIIKTPRSEAVQKTTTGRSRPTRQQSNIIAPTVWGKYKTQLTTLMSSLRKTQSRYIRCIKPNNRKKPLIMEHTPVVDQLRCAGVIAGITISRSAFPNRLPNSAVVARFSHLWDSANYKSKKTSSMTADQKRAEDCKALMLGALKGKEYQEGGKTIRAFVVGKTRTYFRAGALEWLEANRKRGFDSQAITIQRAARGWLSRNSGSSVKKQRKLAELERQRKEMEAAQRQLRLAKEAAERKQRRAQEHQSLRDEMAALQRQLGECDAEARVAVAQQQTRKERLEDEVKELKRESELLNARKLQDAKALKARQESQIAQAAKLISMLKKENTKMRRQRDKMEVQYDETKATHDLICGNHTDLNSSLSDIDGAAMKVHGKYQTLNEQVEEAKTYNDKFRKEVDIRQNDYMSVAQHRLELQKTMANILTMVQSTCKDRNLVEDIVVTALEAEAEAKSIMAMVDAETSEPDMVVSDVSDSDNSDCSIQVS